MAGIVFQILVSRGEPEEERIKVLAHIPPGCADGDRDQLIRWFDQIPPVPSDSGEGDFFLFVSDGELQLLTFLVEGVSPEESPTFSCLERVRPG